MKIISFILLILATLILDTDIASAKSLKDSVSGMILLNVEKNGEAWYVNPGSGKRFYLGRPKDAFQVMREQGVGIKEWDFQKLAQAGMPVAGDLALAKKLSGKIILEVEKNGEAWYVYPKDLKKYYLGRPEDAFKVMRELGMGISQENLAKVHKSGMDEALNRYSQYLHKTITTKNGSFVTDIIEIDLANPNLRIVTDTADKADCDTGCRATNLAAYVTRNQGFAGINGVYFESYNSAKMNYNFYPVYNIRNKTLLNEDQLKYWTTGPIMAWDMNNKFYYFKDSREFMLPKNATSTAKNTVDYFKDRYGVELQAAIGNRPRLIEDKMNLLMEFDIDQKQRNAKAPRNAIGYKENPSNPGKGKIYLVIAQNATVPDLADILQTMDMDIALNLDGGYSSALWYNDEYMVMPGRNIPNAIVFSESPSVSIAAQ